MRKIGLILDSASGLTIAEANQRGHGFIPLQISINSEVKKAGIGITLEELYENMQDKKNVEIKTSLPAGSDIEAAFEWALERYEKAIYIGISHKVSGTQNAVANVIQLEEKYKDRIYVYESEYGSPWLNLYVEQFEWLLEKYDDFDKIKNILDLAKPYLYALLGPGDIYWFYKGGRISKGAYMAGSLLKVVPILTWENGELDRDKVVKARGTAKAAEKMMEMLKVKTDELEAKKLPYKLIYLTSNNQELTDLIKDKLVEEYDELSRDGLLGTPLSSEQTAHMGPGSLGTALFVSLIDLAREAGENVNTQETEINIKGE